MAYMRGRGTRENPLDIDAVQTTFARPPPPHSGRPRNIIPDNVYIFSVDSDDDIVEAGSANAWTQAQQKPKQRPQISHVAPGSTSIPTGQNLTTRDAARAVSDRSYGKPPAVIVSNDLTSASHLQQSAANRVVAAQSGQPTGNVVTSPSFFFSTVPSSKALRNNPPAPGDFLQNSAPSPYAQIPSTYSPLAQSYKIDVAAISPPATGNIGAVSVNYQAVSPAQHHTVSVSTPIRNGTNSSKQTTSNRINTTPHSVRAEYGTRIKNHTAAMPARVYESQRQVVTQINERKRARKTVTPRDDPPRDDPSMRVRQRLKKRNELPHQALSHAQSNKEARQSPRRPSIPPAPTAITTETSALLHARASVSCNAADDLPAAMSNQREEIGPKLPDSPAPLIFPTDDIERARSMVRNCLKRHLQKRIEAHAYVTSSVLWRQRTCQETEIRDQHSQWGRSNQSVDYTQHVSPFESMPPVQIRLDKKSNNKRSRMFTQDIFTKVKLKDAVFIWACPLTTYTCDATVVPPFKEYISLSTNLLADNQSKLLTTPLILEETDKGRHKLLEELPLHYEMKHDAKGPLDLRNEQCRFYKQSIKEFLEEVGITWVPILYWLFASNQIIKEINGTVGGGRQFEPFLLKRSRYRIEEFKRDEKLKTTPLFNRKGKKCPDFFSDLKRISAEELRISAVISEAVFEECHFSLWYMAQQSDLFQDYVRKKTHSAQAEPRLAYRQAICRVCHQHNCLFHGEHREVPDDVSDSDSDSGDDSSQSSNQPQAQQSKSHDRLHVLSLDNDGSVRSDDSDESHEFHESHDPDDSDDSDDSDDPYARMPAHWDSDSDVERVINYRIPMNSEATKDGSDTIKRRKPPEGAFRADWWQNNYSSLKWNRRKPFYPCKHPGTSCDQAQCRCYREMITCEKSCRCSLACNRRFPGCDCTHTSGKVCSDKNKCLCVQFERECDADLCGTCGATDILDPINRYIEDVLRDRCSNVAIQRGVPRKTLLGESTVHGFGLYAGEDIKKDDYIGEYKGEVISVQESSRRSTIYGYQQTMYLFALNRKQDIDATYMGNKLRFINNADKKYTNCAPKNLLCNQVYRIALYASTNIPAGTELFFDYNYPKTLTATFKQPNQAQSSVVAVKNTVLTQKVKSKASTSQAGNCSSSSLPGQGSTATAKVTSAKVTSAKVTSAKVIAGLQKARAAKVRKAAAKLAESQGAQSSAATALPDRTGPDRLQKSVQVLQSHQGRSARVSQLRSARSSRGRTSRDSTDTPMENTDDSDSRGPESTASRHTDVVQETDDEEEFIPDPQEMEESTNGYDALFPGQSSTAVQVSDDQSPPRRVSRRSRNSAAGTAMAPVVAVKNKKKNRCGARAGAGRPKKNRSTIAFTKDE